ncbi:MAG: hypothetical protein ACJA2M_000017 [Polaribacter sp.]|jgi:hypothetical protein
MSFIEKIKNPIFWSNFFKVVIPFFIVVTLFSLFMNSWREIFAGDFIKVSETNFSDGKWKNFWGIKLFISALYGLYITNKNMK